ncbi:2-dehydropantoate 2-reductase [Alcaligenaceae bacterium]|nr:2-dehydropantoate 2-reductase [Alcaligenaceae bacterium]
MKAAIVGVGSLGTIMGALMTQKGYAIQMVDANAEHVDALNRDGATITGAMSLTVPVQACLPEQMSGTYDLIILMNKQTTNSVVLPNLLKHLHDSSIVCTLQNGIPEEDVAAVVGAHRTIGGAVGFGATWLRPGVSQLTTDADTMRQFAFEIGELDGVMRPRLKDVQAYLGCVGQTDLLPNLMGIRWAKLLMNATFSGMSAALGCTFGEVLNNPKAMVCIAFIANECIRVSHAHGIILEPMQGADMSDLAFDTAQQIPEKMPLYQKIWGPHVNLKASMLQDLEKGRDCEILQINGVVCRKGREVGIATPFNDKVVELVSSAQTRRGVNDYSYLEQFMPLIEQYAPGV